MRLLNVTAKQWELAEKYFENNPTATKMSKRENADYPAKSYFQFLNTSANKERNPNILSFIKINNQIYAVENALLGEGGCSNIKRVQSKDGRNFAMKIEGDVIKNFTTDEAVVLKHLGKLEAIGVRDSNKPFKGRHELKKHYTIFQLETGENLLNKFYSKDVFGLYYNGKLTLTEKIIVAIKCCQQLDDLHKQRVIHGDVKPENFLIDDAQGEVALIDLGFAKILPENETYVEGISYGTMSYIAPEIAEFDVYGNILLNFDKQKSRYSFASDIYALGKMLENDFQLTDDNLNIQGKNLTDPDPAKRPSLEEVIFHLIHELKKQPDNNEDGKNLIASYELNAKLQKMLATLNNENEKEKMPILPEKESTLSKELNAKLRKMLAILNKENINPEEMDPKKRLRFG